MFGFQVQHKLRFRADQRCVQSARFMSVGFAFFRFCMVFTESPNMSEPELAKTVKMFAAAEAVNQNAKSSAMFGFVQQ